MATKFNIVKKGYEPSEVDEYIENMECIIKSYKDKDTAIKNAILNAQLAADNIIKNAKLEAVKTRTAAYEQISEIVLSVAAQRDMVRAFQNDYNSLVVRYLHRVEEEDIKLILDRIGVLEKYLSKFKPESAEIPVLPEQANDSPPYQPVTIQDIFNNKADS